MVTRDAVQTALALHDNAVEGHLWQELHECCLTGDTVALDKLVKEEADVRHQEPDKGMSALMVAAAKGHEQIVKTLLENGSPWNSQDKEEQSAGDHAQLNGHAQVLLCFAIARVVFCDEKDFRAHALYFYLRFQGHRK